MKRTSEIFWPQFPNVSRRKFVKMALAAGATIAAGPRLWGAEPQNDVPLRPLGRTGEKVSAIGLGGYHIGTQGDEQLSIRIVRNQKWNQPPNGDPCKTTRCQHPVGGTGGNPLRVFCRRDAGSTFAEVSFWIPELGQKSNLTLPAVGK